MPTDTRLQILAVSKDIIHSWSIPSAGIKIDCIPGYSSHRVALFTLSGIYWGQCMEICGRFHHWMPIVVYFIRRDLFCVWCVHFVFKNKQLNSVLQSFDQSFYDSSPAVSLDWSSWNYEL
jgi:heme/copper-type cytochrome/quinol oxidase subunit 2